MRLGSLEHPVPSWQKQKVLVKGLLGESKEETLKLMKSMWEANGAQHPAATPGLRLRGVG